jgi:predicted GNAT family acetyltransferase
MVVTRHTDPQAFFAAAAPLVARGVATATAIASLADWLASEAPAPDEDLYLATQADGAGGGIAFRRRDRAVRIENSDAEAAVAFARDIATDWPRLQGVVGTLASCEAFAHAWRELTGRACALRFHLRSHLLTDVNATPGAPGAMRPASADDVGWLIAAFATFIVEAGLPEEPTHAATVAPKSVERDEIRIWDDGGPKAFARWTPAGEAARLGPVWTTRRARRAGYATALVAALSRELLAAGRRTIVLDTDVTNPTSNSVYARIGFRPAYDFYHFDFVDT